jgi:hypothetical protein
MCYGEGQNFSNTPIYCKEKNIEGRGQDMSMRAKSTYGYEIAAMKEESRGKNA